MTYRMEASARRVMLLCGIGFGIVALFGAAVFVFERDGAFENDAAIAAAAVAFAAVAWWCVDVWRNAARHDVELTGAGIRPGGGDVVPWSAIVAMREHRIRERLVLFDASGRRLAAIEYQLERIDEVLAEIWRRSRVRETVSPKTTLGARRARSDVALNALFLLVMLAVSTWLWTESRHWIALVLPLLLLWSLYIELRDTIRQVELRDDALVLRTFLRESALDANQIASASLTTIAVRGRRSLACGLTLRDGRRLTLRPAGVDPVVLTESIARWVHARSGRRRIDMAMASAPAIKIAPP